MQVSTDSSAVLLPMLYVVVGSRRRHRETARSGGTEEANRAQGGGGAPRGEQLAVSYHSWENKSSMWQLLSTVRRKLWLQNPSPRLWREAMRQE